MAGRTRWPRGRQEAALTLGALAVLMVLLMVADLLVDEPLRRHMERRMNERLDGYTVRISRLDFHLLGFSVDLHDLSVAQQEHPDPPVLRVARLTAGVHWRALLFGQVVADVRFDRPVVHVNLTQLRAEARDRLPIEGRGWQEALEQVFDSGRLRLRGDADFLAIPHPAVRGDVALKGMQLDYVQPVLARYNLWVTRGILTADGTLEYAPNVRVAHLKDLSLQDVAVDYVHTPRTAAAEAAVGGTVAAAAKDASNAPGLLLRVDRLQSTKATVGYVNREARSSYRVFLADARLDVTNLSNQATEGTAAAQLQGRFMGSGATTVRATFRPETRGADFDVAVRIENTQLKSLNDLLRAHGKFDVATGLFSICCELAVRGDRITGYVKPLFKDLDVYDPEQDKHKNVIQKVYEGVVAGLAKLLENRPRDEVATKAELRGTVKDPKASTWQIVVGLIQNAFFEAILPGFDREVRRLRG